MATVTTLTIDQIEVQYSLSGLDDVVIQVQATLSGNDTGTTYSLTNGFLIAGPTLSAFTPYDDLTESQVAGFVEATDRYTSLYQYLTTQIYDRKQPPTEGILPLPWG
tara:strand:- start:6 stop:326 length:321 start_codon:yes stop_codon:yes gene_type:complete